MRKHLFLVLVLVLASLPFIYLGVSAMMDDTAALDYEIVRLTDTGVLVKVTNTSSRPFDGYIAMSDGTGTMRQTFIIGGNEEKTVTLGRMTNTGRRQFRVWFENK